MRIAIDARMMGPLATRGIGRYVEELVRGFLHLETGHMFVLLVRHPEMSPFLGRRDVEHVRADVPWYSVAEQLSMPRLYAAARADLVHVPHWNVPLAYRGPLVTTVHDLLLRREPHSAKVSTRHPFMARIKRAGYLLALRHATRAAQRILVPTRAVAEDVRAFYPACADRVLVTGEGIPDLPPPDLSILPRFRLRASSFAFYVGSAYPHKDLDALLDAWRTIALKHPSHALVIAGEEDVFMARHVARVRAEQLPRVVFTGRVTDAELAALYDAAALFVFPSRTEGFGLPPLEALSHGCPVVASDAPSLVEILPKAGVRTFRRGSADDMIREIDGSLRGLSQMKEDAQSASAALRDAFRWEDVARRTLTAYEQALQR